MHIAKVVVKVLDGWATNVNQQPSTTTLLNYINMEVLKNNNNKYCEE